MNEDYLTESYEYDTKFLLRISSTYLALCEVVARPITIDGKLYDLVEKDIEAMKFRIEQDPISIENHIKYFRRFIKNFDEMGESSNCRNRDKVVGAVAELFLNLEEYSRVVSHNQEIMGNSSFLCYPHCLGNHHFYRSGMNEAVENLFNTSKSKEGIHNERRRMNSLLRKISSFYETVPSFRPADLTDLRDGNKSELLLDDWFDETTELLKEAGFKFSRV